MALVETADDNLAVLGGYFRQQSDRLRQRRVRGHFHSEGNEHN